MVINMFKINYFIGRLNYLYKALEIKQFIKYNRYYFNYSNLLLSTRNEINILEIYLKSLKNIKNSDQNRYINMFETVRKILGPYCTSYSGINDLNLTI